MKYAILTVDVETDWGGRSDVDCQNRGLEAELPILLSILKKEGIKATFFISGILLPKYKKQILKIKNENHEIASHGIAHKDISRLSKKEFGSELEHCKRAFKKELGIDLKGFRAPQFRIKKENFEVLDKLGFKYDSSLVKSFFIGRRNNISSKAQPFRIQNNLIEVPVSSTKFLNIPLGLLWVNNIGFSFFKLISDLFKLNNVIVIYLHPFDLVKDKGRYKSSLLLNIWYRYKEKKAYKTFSLLVKYLKGKEYSFLKVEDLIKKYEYALK